MDARSGRRLTAIYVLSGLTPCRLLLRRLQIAGQVRKRATGTDAEILGHRGQLCGAGPGQPAGRREGAWCFAIADHGPGRAAVVDGEPAVGRYTAGRLCLDLGHVHRARLQTARGRGRNISGRNGGETEKAAPIHAPPGA